MERSQFDLQVHVRDQKSQRIIEEKNYILHCHKEHGQVFERDGKFYDLQGIEADGSRFITGKKKVEVVTTVETKPVETKQDTVVTVKPQPQTQTKA